MHHTLSGCWSMCFSSPFGFCVQLKIEMKWNEMHEAENGLKWEAYNNKKSIACAKQSKTISHWVIASILCESKEMSCVRAHKCWALGDRCWRCRTCNVAIKYENIHINYKCITPNDDRFRSRSVFNWMCQKKGFRSDGRKWHRAPMAQLFPLLGDSNILCKPELPNHITVFNMRARARQQNNCISISTAPKLNYTRKRATKFCERPPRFQHNSCSV